MTIIKTVHCPTKRGSGPGNKMPCPGPHCNQSTMYHLIVQVALFLAVLFCADFWWKRVVHRQLSKLPGPVSVPLLGSGYVFLGKNLFPSVLHLPTVDGPLRSRRCTDTVLSGTGSVCNYQQSRARAGHPQLEHVPGKTVDLSVHTAGRDIFASGG